MATPFICSLIFLTTVTITFSQEAPLTFRIQEELDTGERVGSVRAANLTVPEDEVDTLRYNFLVTQHYFSIEDVSGNIFTMVKINRELVCQGFQSDSSECEIDFEVAAKTDGTYYRTIDVKVIIEDINDNFPLFPSASYQLNISEGTSVNSEQSIPSAEDLDAGVNGIERYEMSPQSSTFELKYTKNLVGTFKVSIILKEPLDRETRDSYQFTVTAFDGGSPPKSGSMVVNVAVTDINDNEPVFDQSEYTKTVEEGTKLGVTVLTVHASDLDIGENGRVSYRIQEGFTVNDFALDSTTGDITVGTDQLVYQPDLKYEFVVEAYDHGQQSKFDEAWVRISVSDTGNNRPIVTVKLLSPGNIGFVNVSEDSKKGYFVAHVTVEDSDTGMNGNVSCSTGDNYFSIINLEDKVHQYKVVVNNPLNREIQDIHTVNVTCTDRGDPPLSSSETFLVRVTDHNDNKPIFLESSYRAKVSENIEEEKVILQVSATDKDIGNNSEIYYAIRNQDTRLTVNPVTGVVSVKPFFDRETTPVVVFEVLAIDKGDPALTGTATVTLTIEDENDNPPEFLQTSYSFEVLENMPSGTSVGKLSARDIDIGSNAVFTFSLAEEYQNIRLPFVVMPQDGVIQTIRALDREEVKSYSFIATALDQGNPPLQSSVRVTVTVKDENDNRPVISFPGKDNMSVSISYPNNNLDVVANVLATDPDEGENGTLKYNIVGGNDLGLFKMSLSSGLISIADHSVKIDKDTSAILIVQVSDSGSNSFTSSAELIINITYSNATYEEISSDENKIIVIVVVVVTVLLSGIIVTMIVVIRKRDSKKKTPESEIKAVANDYVNKPSVYILNNTGESSTDYQITNNDVGRKKKEVSFSLDEHDSINNYQHTDLRVNLAPEPIKYAPEKVGLNVNMFYFFKGNSNFGQSLFSC